MAASEASKLIDSEAEEEEERDVVGAKSMSASVMATGATVLEALAHIGPGFIVAASLVDPGNIAGDMQLGVSTGDRLLWVVLVGTFIAQFYQMLAARVGVATERTLAEVTAEQYHSVPRFVALALLESTVIGADVQEILGSAIGLMVLSNGIIPLWAGVLLTSLNTFVFLILQEIPLGMRIIEVVFTSLITIMTLAFLDILIVAGVDFPSIVKGTFIPNLRASDLSVVAGMIGAVVMPFNLFLHSYVVHNKAVNVQGEHHNSGAKTKTMWFLTMDSSIAFALSFIVNMSITAVFARGFASPSYKLAAECTADNLGLTNAAKCLEKVFGKSSLIPIKYAWGLGLFASGQGGTTACTMAGQSILTGFLDYNAKAKTSWTRILLIRAFALIPALLISIFVRSAASISTAYLILNILQSVMLPFAMLPLLHAVSSRSIMTKRHVMSKLTAILAGWPLALLIIALNASLVTFSIQSIESIVIRSCLYGLSIPYAMIVLYSVLGPDTVRTLLGQRRKSRPEEISLLGDASDT